MPPRPSAASPIVQDAYRQTHFLLSAELATFEQAMNVQLQIVAANAKARTPEAAAMFAFWSRTFGYLESTCALICQGSYASCAPVLRSACDCIAAQRSILADGFAEYREWLAGAIAPARDQAALAFDLGRFRAGSVLAEDERLGGVYRLLTDLSMPHFGATALQTAPDSSLQRLAISFGDGTFHLAWAEVIAGWLLLLADAQLTAVVSSGVFAIDHATLAVYQSIAREISAALANTRRCYVEEAGGRFLFHNFRRTAAAAPRRVLL